MATADSHLFSTLTKVKTLSFPRGKRKCGTVDRIRYLPDGRVAALGRCEDEFSADTIFFWKTKTSIMPTKVIKDNIGPAVDMAVTSSGGIMVLRKERPHIRVFGEESDKFQDTDVQLDEKTREELMFLETDSNGYILIVHGEQKPQLLVIGPKGVPVQSVNLGKAGGMFFDNAAAILRVAADEKITRYKWDKTSLNDISPEGQGKRIFGFTDVGLGGGGEVISAGSIDGVVNVYQLKEGDEDNVKELKFADKTERRSYSPWICVCGDQVILEYGLTIELFKLS